jgi:mRNA interferase YafQ
MAKKVPRPAGGGAPTPPPPPAVTTTARFERDVGRLKKRGLDMAKLRAVIDALCSHATLPASLRDHGLRGERAGCRDCHVAPDWVLIYERGEGAITLHRTGTRADLFE